MASDDGIWKVRSQYTVKRNLFHSGDFTSCVLCYDDICHTPVDTRR